MSVEIKITMKDSERKLTKDFNIYDIIRLSESDPIINSCIKEVRDEFKGEPEDIIIRATMVL